MTLYASIQKAFATYKEGKSNHCKTVSVYLSSIGQNSRSHKIQKKLDLKCNRRELSADLALSEFTFSGGQASICRCDILDETATSLRKATADNISVITVGESFETKTILKKELWDCGENSEAPRHANVSQSSNVWKSYKTTENSLLHAIWPSSMIKSTEQFSRNI